MRKGYIDTPEGQVHYRTDGSGENLLMLHQTPTSSDEYSRLIPLLAAKYHVFAMDTLGYGMSDIPTRKLSIEEYAQNVVQFMDALGIDKAHVFGHHTGAILAVEVATTHPNRIGKMVLSGCPSWTEEERLTELKRPAYHHIVLDEAGEFVMRKWGLYKMFCAAGAKPEVWFPGFVASVSSGTRTHDGHIAAFEYDVLSRLSRVSQPVLLVSGDRDQFLAELECTGKIIPNCRTGVIQGGGTIVSLEAPEALAKAILDFI